MGNRNLSALLEKYIQNDSVLPFVAVRLVLDAGDLLVWSGGGDLSLGGRTYVGAGNLLSMASLQESTDFSSPSLTLTLSGMNDAVLTNALSVDYQNREAFIEFGVLDAGGGVASNFTIFSGRIATMGVDENPDNPKVSVNVTSRLEDMSRPKTRRLTHEEQQELYAGDKGLSHVAALQDKEIEWGVTGSGTSAALPDIENPWIDMHMR